MVGRAASDVNRDARGTVSGMNTLFRLGRALGDRLSLQAALVALNAPLAVLLLARNLRGLPREPLTVVYTAGAVLGWYLAPALLVGAVIGLLLARWRRTALAVTAALLAVYLFYLLIDGFVFAVYKFHVDFFWLGFLLHDFSGLGIPPSMVLLAAGALAALAGLEVLLARWTLRLRRRGRLAGWFTALVLAALAVSQVLHVAAYEVEDTRITGVTARLPFYVPLRSHHHAVRYGHLLPMVHHTAPAPGDSAAAALAAAETPAGSFRYPLAPIRRDSPARRPNIVWILLESWRADTMNREVTPRIAGLADSATVCLNHFSTGNSTVAGLFGMFYGLYPTYWEAVKSDAARIDNPVLIDVLREEGYDFGLFARSHFKRHKIQDTVFRGYPVVEKFRGRSADQWDRDLTDRMLAFIDDHADGRPFFALGFYKASHFNYNYDAAHAKFRPARKLSSGLVGGRRENPEIYLNDYRNSVFFDDDQVGRILDRLQERGLLRNTIVVITTDHAEEFNDDGADYWGHGSNFTRWQTQVPLVLYCPGRPPQRITARTSHLDLPPTLLRACLGVRNDPADYSDGRTLFEPLPPGRPLVVASYFNHAFIVGDDVYAVLPLGMKSYRLDDITRPAAPPDPRVLRRLMADLGRFYGAAGAPSVSPPAAETTGPAAAAPATH